jgi:hypothetical protein
MLLINGSDVLTIVQCGMREAEIQTLIQDIAYSGSVR